MSSLIVAIVLVAAILVTASRILSFKTLLGLATPIDVVFTVMLFFIFSGTLAGMVIATIAGLVMAITLSVGRYFFGYNQITFARKKWYKGFVSLGWRAVPSKIYPQEYQTWTYS
ncbi:hypothetical protein [uncultured Paraglaciecola sp.]|uniref:hypothetical protein n=1 Tax=uncultured Paraglaciecola sp. TaxID=1765024 RepID=UPI00262196E9|nr:hypothetical protein [uncultured Paraglaciecola sp.]